MTGIENDICRAIDIIVKKYMSELRHDKTVLGQIIRREGNKYKIKYQDSTFYAFGSDVYTEGDSVYILIPENNTSKPKFIIGKENMKILEGDDNAIKFIDGIGPDEDGNFDLTKQGYLKEDNLPIGNENIAGVVIVDKEFNETSNNPIRNNIITKKIEDIEEQLDKVFTSVSNGKELVASAITDKGVTTDKDATFETMAENIKKISTGTVDTVYNMRITNYTLSHYKNMDINLKISNFELLEE